MSAVYLRRPIQSLCLAVCLTFSTASMSAVDQVIAVVNNNVILNSELTRAIHVQIASLQARNAPIPPTEILAKMTLRDMILNSIQNDMIKQMGLQVPEEMLNNALLNVAKSQNLASIDELQKKMNESDPQAFKYFRSHVKNEIAIEQLHRQRISPRINITEQDVNRYLSSPANAESLSAPYKILAVTLNTLPSLTPAQQTTFNQLKNTIEQSVKSNQLKMSDYNALSVAPFTVSAEVTTLASLATLPPAITSQVEQLNPNEATSALKNETDLQWFKLLDKNATDPMLIQQHETAHILIKPSAVMTEQATKLKINQIYQRIQKGEDFSILARTFSEDTGSARKGGSLGWVSRGEMVREFENVMLKTSVNDYSVPFQTQFGWHILKVNGQRMFNVTTQTQRNLAKNAIFKTQYQQELDDWLREIYAKAFVEIKPMTPAS